MFPYVAFTVLVLLSLIAAYYALRTLWHGSIAYLPTTGWLFFIVFPFVIEFLLLDEQARMTQWIAIAVVLSAFFSIDTLAAKISIRNAARINEPRAINLSVFAYVLGALFIVLTGWHLLDADDIPIITAITQGMDDITVIDESRAAFSRDAAMPAALRYITNFSIMIIGLPAVLILMLKKHYMVGTLLLGWVVLYSISSMAKAPIFSVVFALMLGICVILLARSFGQKFLRGLIVLGFIGLVAITLISLFNPWDGTIQNIPEKLAQAETIKIETGFRPTLGDFARLRPAELDNSIPFVLRKADYLLYRMFFTPMEVSARWYEYFDKYPVSQIHLGRQVIDSRTNTSIHPANIIGIWAYYDRFPANYSDEVYAYASFDADAHARFGWLGFLAALLGLCGLRLFIALYSDEHGQTRGAFTICALNLLFFLPSIASIQAILVAQGLITVALILFALAVWERRVHPFPHK